MMMLLMLNFFISITFIFLTHPLSMGLMLILQTLTISLISGNIMYNYWFSYIIFLIMVGGMLILFIYMTSIASNEKFTWKITPIFFIPIIVVSVLMSYNFNILKTNNTLMTHFQEPNMFMKLMNYPMNLILFFMIIYLFITLIAMVNISNFNQGPLRQMN
uniref:NADH-ubiquinone oxidoreductase chain 6 n=1 Tax=Elateroides dermestoides TaxID=295947 RepID=E3VTD6_9CUCU|nr:NADH dehydrogenase subunit 6 [Elateroides dermestoides]